MMTDLERAEQAIRRVARKPDADDPERFAEYMNVAMPRKEWRALVDELDRLRQFERAIDGAMLNPQVSEPARKLHAEVERLLAENADGHPGRLEETWQGSRAAPQSSDGAAG